MNSEQQHQSKKSLQLARVLLSLEQAQAIFNSTSKNPFSRYMSCPCPELYARRIEDETKGQVTKNDIRPDLFPTLEQVD